MWRWTKSPMEAPDKEELITLSFVNGDPVAINNQKLKAHEIFHTLNDIGSRNGIGRLDLVENRFVGMKSRGCYETLEARFFLRLIEQLNHYFGSRSGSFER